MAKKILVMGAAGQIGSELTIALSTIYGIDKVIASDIKPLTGAMTEGVCEIHDCTNIEQTANIVKKHGIKTIYNLPALLSAVGEAHPQKAFKSI